MHFASPSLYEEELLKIPLPSYFQFMLFKHKNEQKYGLPCNDLKNSQTAQFSFMKTFLPFVYLLINKRIFFLYNTMFYIKLWHTCSHPMVPVLSHTCIIHTGSLAIYAFSSDWNSTDWMSFISTLSVSNFGNELYTNWVVQYNWIQFNWSKHIHKYVQFIFYI